MGATAYKWDAYGSDEQLRLIGQAVADGFVWMSGAINIGTASSPELPRNRDSFDV